MSRIKNLYIQLLKSMRIGFSGSCHWCTEAVFQTLIGVFKVEQGWISSVEDEDFHEGVVVHFDEENIDLETLVEVHLRTHNSTSDHSMRRKYRSAVYTFSKEQRIHSDRILKKLQNEFEDTLITKTLTFLEFKTSDAAFQNYYRQNPQRPFCKSYIDPKLKLIFEQFSDYVKS